MTTKARVTRTNALNSEGGYEAPGTPEPDYSQVDFDWDKLTEGIERPEKDYDEIGLELMRNYPLPTGGLCAENTEEDEFDAYLMEFMF